MEEVCRVDCWTEEKMRGENSRMNSLSMAGNKACSPREAIKEALCHYHWNIIIYQISKPLRLQLIGDDVIL
jgi:hypothetical protein